MTERIWKITHPETGEVIYTSREPQVDEPMRAGYFYREDGRKCVPDEPVWLNSRSYSLFAPAARTTWAEEVTDNPPEWWLDLTRK